MWFGCYFSGTSVDVWLHISFRFFFLHKNNNNDKLTSNNKIKLIEENKRRRTGRRECTPENEVAALTGAVVVHNGDGFPLEELHQIQDGTAEGREVRVEADVEGVLVVGHLVLPAGLYVRNPQGIADGLDCVCWRAVWRPKDSSHPKWQLITSWRGERSLLIRRGKEGRRELLLNPKDFFLVKIFLL